VGDLHIVADQSDILPYQELLEQVNDQADLLLLVGDLTHTGLPAEAELLVKALRVCRRPVLAVLGNHDYHSDQAETVRQILKAGGIQFIDERLITVKGVNFAGVKGFGGGFDAHTLAPFGETVMKAYATEGVKEALQLETLLREEVTGPTIVGLHYSPIAATVTGEPREIFPFLGSSRLEETINRFNVTAVFHGHAHFGVLEGQTSRGIPVYNCARAVLEHQSPPLLFFKKIISSA
jgi:Icc-related predicted phosphoesterase